MNKQLKELAEQAGLQNTLGCFWQSGDHDIERFAELVRDDERAKCAADYLQDCCDAVDAARLEEREACAKALETGVDLKGIEAEPLLLKLCLDVVGGCATLIRARGNHEQD